MRRSLRSRFALCQAAAWIPAVTDESGSPLLFLWVAVLLALLISAFAPTNARATPLMLSAPVPFTAHNEPESVAIGDLNGDTKLDFAAANVISNDVSVRLGNGSGGFSPATNFLVHNFPSSVAIGNLNPNTDTFPDLAVANANSTDVSVLLGNGSGGFSAATNFPAHTLPVSVAIGNLNPNTDTYPDLVIANSASNDVSVLLGNGSGGFSAPTNLPVHSSPQSVAIGNVNPITDTYPDLVVANAGSQDVSVLFGNGSGGFSAATNFAAHSNPYSVAIGDLNGDTKPDLATANSGSNDASVLFGNASGSFSAPTNFSVASGPRSVGIADFNGDGTADIATANTSTVSILLGIGAGSFSPSTSFDDAGGPFWSMAIGDLNGDTRPDLAVPNRTYVEVLFRSDFPHPQSASQIRVSHVPTFRQCGTPANATNSRHATPLGVGSCDPPQTLSPSARTGSGGTGSATMTVQTTPTSDVLLNVSDSDIETAAGADYDPNGAGGNDLSAVFRLRLSDLNSCRPTPCSSSYTWLATGTDTDFPAVPINCVPNGSPSASPGSDCNTSTSANAVAPGSVVAGQQAVWNIFRVRVNDSAGNLFQQQGFFVP
jgi:hypothetical protein